MSGETTSSTVNSGLGAGRTKLAGVWKMIAATALIAAIAGAALFWKKSAPSPKGDVVEIARFVSRSAFDDLSEEQKRPYMDALRFKIDKVNEAHSAGQLDERQYKVAGQCAWMSRQLDHMDTYFGLPAGKQREAYLDKVIDKKLASGTGKPKAENVARDDEFMSNWSQNWSGTRRVQFEEYRDALKARYKARGLVKQ